MRALRRAPVFILLGLTLGISGAWASPPKPPAPGHAEQVSSAKNLFGYLGGLFTSLWLKTGCSMDPWGRCAPAPTQNTDTGCGIDPLGRCATPPPPTLSTDTGCGIDPWGLCAPNH